MLRLGGDSVRMHNVTVYSSMSVLVWASLGLEWAFGLGLGTLWHLIAQSVSEQSRLKSLLVGKQLCTHYPELPADRRRIGASSRYWTSGVAALLTVAAY
jgi:hypothetical protein